MSIALYITQLFQRNIRISLENEKLKIDAEKGALTNEIKQELVSKKQAILDYLLEKKAQPGLPNLKVIERNKSILLMSSAQKRLWFLQQLDPESGQYNVNSLLELKGNINISLINSIFIELINEHEIFRTRFAERAGEPDVKLINTKKVVNNFNIDSIDLMGSDLDSTHYNDVLRSTITRSFDLSNPPLFRLTLLKINNTLSHLVLTFHHIVIDHWSLQLLNKLFLQKCQIKLQNKTPSADQSINLQYLDYAAWQHTLLKGEYYQNLRDYWRKTLGTNDYCLTLPTDRPKTLQTSHQGTRFDFELGNETFLSLQHFCKQHQITLNTVLLAAYQWLLARRSSMSEIRVACPVSERPHQALENMLGLFVNTMVVKSEWSAGLKTNEWIDHVNKAFSGAKQHSAMPFEKLVDDLVVSREGDHDPLVQTMFNYLVSEPNNPIQLADMTLLPIPVPEYQAKFDLSLFANNDNEHLRLSFQYRIELFDSETISDLATQFIDGLTYLISANNKPLAEHSTLSKYALEKLYDWNTTRIDYNKPLTLSDALLQQSQATPNKIALRYQSLSWTYRELDKKVNQLANWLIEKNCQPEDRIAICMTRSPQMLVSMLAVLKVGCAYVPLDPEHPRQRLDYILEHSAPTIVLTLPALNTLFEPINLVNKVSVLDDQFSLLDGQSYDFIEPTYHPQQLAYILYTSGSTGQPKGVAIPHSGIMNRLYWMQSEYGLSQQDVVLQKTPYSFDVSVWEFFWPLITGATLVLAGAGEHKDSDKLVNLINHYKVTTLHFVPAMLQGFLDNPNAANCNTLKNVFCSGEALPYQLQQQFLSTLAADLHNLYGPTEASIDVTYWNCRKQHIKDIVPIGSPIANIQTWILDEELNPVPIGVEGQLYLAGVGLARGYFNRPDLTAETFIPNPFAKADAIGDAQYNRLYRTGDLARYRTDGNIEYVGRADFQVKIRGLRIELGEIEARIAEYPSIKEVVVLACRENTLQHNTPSDFLAAYIVMQSGSTLLELDNLKSYLAESLPEYMIPTAFVELALMPLSANGKVDRKSLPTPDLAQLNSVDFIAPQSSKEIILADIWKNLLNIEQVGIKDNFFAIGGDSIISLQVVARARDKGLGLDPKDIFRHQTIQALAELATQEETQDYKADQVFGEIPLNAIQQWYLDQPLCNPDHFNQAILLSSSVRIDESKLAQALQSLIQHHPILKARFKYQMHTKTWFQKICKEDVIFNDVDLKSPLTLYEKECDKTVEKQVIIDDIAASEQASLNLEKGEVFRTALIRFSESDCRLMLIAHHLIIDGVSWRILLTQLSELYQGLCSHGILPEVRYKTAPFKLWSQQAKQYHPNAEGIVKWHQWVNKSEHQQAIKNTLPIDAIEIDFLPGEQGSYQVALNTKQTTQLLQQAGKPLRAHIDELCLSALSFALTDWTGSQHHLLHLEGHGRDWLDLDLSQTVGWFTRLYPSVISTCSKEWLEHTLNIRRQLNNIPESETPFSTVKPFLNEELSPQIVFNYLGQLDNDQSSSFMQKAPEKMTGFRHEANPLMWSLEINAFVSEGQFKVNFQYAKGEFLPETIKKLSTYYTGHLTAMLDTLCGLHNFEKGAIAADFPFAKLNDSQVLRLVKKYTKRHIEDIYPLTPVQQGMLFHCLDHEHDYISQSVASCEGLLHIDILRSAWYSVVERHSALRTVIINEDVDEPHQVVFKHADLSIQSVDWQAMTDQQKTHEMTTLRESEQAKIQLDKAPMMRVVLIKNTQEKYQLIWTIHHLIMDGWCLNVLINEVMQSYFSRLPDNKISSKLSLLKPAVPFRNFIEWLQQRDEEGAEEFWRNHLNGFTATNVLPATYSHADTAIEQGYIVIDKCLGTEKTTKLAQLCQSQTITLNTLIQGLWGIVLSRYMGSRDIVYGVTTSGRPSDLPGADRILGVFINTLPLRIDLSSDISLHDWLIDLQYTNLTMRDFEQTPMAKIQRVSSVSQDQALFETLLVFENLPASEGQPQHGLTLTLENHYVRNNFPLTLRVVPKDDLQFDLLLDLERINKKYAIQMVADLTSLIDNILCNEDSMQKTANTLMIVPYPVLEKPFNKPLESVLERIISHSKTATALLVDVDGEQVSISYDRLLSQAKKLAASLPNISETHPIYAIFLPRQYEQIVAMLAIWWKGGSWLCIDPELPNERVLYMLNDAKVSCVLGVQPPQYWSNTETFKVYTWINIKTLLSSPLTGNILPLITTKSDDTAYIIYTSGSTGQPKGVVVTHRNVLSYVDGFFERVNVAADARMATLATVSADLGLTCVLGAITTGRQLSLLPNRFNFDPTALAEYLERFPVDVLKIVPSHLRALLSVDKPDRLLPLQWLISGGEALTSELVDLVRNLSPGINIANHYGPTEATIGCMAKVLEDNDSVISLGRPFNNSLALVVDSYGLPVNQGVEGELWIAGEGVSNGYLNKPDQTLASFTSLELTCSNNNQNIVKVYKTGDKVRETETGEFLYLGRIDDQVKIRGFRVELEEVKQQILSVNEVSDAVVITINGPSGLRLAACVVMHDVVGALDWVKTQLSLRLPDYMQPSIWHIVDVLPLNGNGKIDRSQVAKDISKNLSTNQIKEVKERPRSLPDASVAETLATIWGTLLEKRPEANENLFSLGVDSIICLQFIAKARNYKWTFTPKQIFSAPTITEQCLLITPNIENNEVYHLNKSDNSSSTTDIDPASKTETALTQLWASLLNQPVELDDNFFSLGGDSIITLQMIAKAKSIGISLTPKMVFDSPTIRMLTRRVNETALLSNHEVNNHNQSNHRNNRSDLLLNQSTEESLIIEHTPSTHQQIMLIWQEMFQLESIDADANFFNLGGDSIMALQLIAKLSKFGLKLTPKQIFTSPNLDKLAAFLDQSQAISFSENSEKGSSLIPNAKLCTNLSEDKTQQSNIKKNNRITNKANLLPIQHWFFEVEQPVVEYWNQAIMLALPQAVRHDAMMVAINELVTKHPALSCCFSSVRKSPNTHQKFTKNTAGIYAAFDNQTLEGVESIVQHYQQSLDLKTGSVFKVVVFNLKQGGARIMLLAHHLVVDGVSWRIIGSDLSQAYQAACLGNTIELGQSTASVLDWQKQLQVYPLSALTDARAFWLPMVARSLDGQFITGVQNGTIANAVKVEQVFDKKITKTLLNLGTIKERSSVEVAMLTALTQAISNEFNKPKVMIELEGHGRHAADNNIDLSETVGWFTVRYPITFDARNISFDSVANTLASVPDQGIGYGVLRYLKEELAFEHPQLVFNYLGQINSNNSEWQLIKDGVGQCRHPDSIRRQLIEVTAQIREGELHISWQYPEELTNKLQGVLLYFKHQLNNSLKNKNDHIESFLLPQAIKQAKRQEVIQYPLTPMQQGMFLDSVSTSGSIYFNQTAVELNGKLNIKAFMNAWQKTIDAEQILKAGFEEHSDQAPTQWFAENATLPICHHNWTDHPLESQIQKLDALCRDDRNKGFVLNKPPLMRLHIITVDVDKNWLIWSRHHIIVDAWCSSLVIKDVMHRYLNLMGQTSSNPIIRPPFSDYLLWLAKQNVTQSKAFWKKELKGFQTPIHLMKGKVHDTFHLEDHVLSSDLTQSIKALAKKCGVTLNAVIQAAWAQTLAHHSSQKDIVFGMTTSGRPAEMENANDIIGIFINTLPVRIKLNPMMNIKTLLQDIHQQGARLREFEYTPLTDIIAESELNRDQSLFESLLVFENEAMSEKSQISEHLTVNPLQAYERNSLPLSITVMPRDEMILRVGCDGEKLSYDHVLDMIVSFQAILGAMVSDQTTLVGNIVATMSNSLSLSIVTSNKQEWDASWTLENQISSIALRYSDNIAVTDYGVSLTYSQLIKRSRHVAQSLVEQGIGADSTIAVYQQRTADLLVSLLAIYWTGAAYIPLDPNQPQDRLKLILEEADPALIIIDDEQLPLKYKYAMSTLSSLLSTCLYNENWHINYSKPHPEQLAYIIFTSGSTGRPKGVQISRSAFANFLQSMMVLTNIKHKDRLLAVTTIGFDIAGLEMFLPLLCGAQIYIASYDETRDGSRLATLITQKMITFMQATPTTWQMLAEQERLNWSALTVLSGGEALPVPLAKYIVKNKAHLFNVYGPTETTVWSSIEQIDEQRALSPTLGLPIANTDFYILDEWLNPVAKGAEGVLYIGGLGLARGYLGQADLTANAFLPDPFSLSSGMRMYDTGDVVRINAANKLEFIGRKDFQLKLRGYRIETAEIETLLAKQEDVKESVVKLWHAGSPQACLIGYVTVTSKITISTDSLMEKLRESLPSYMVPKSIVVLDEMPLNSNNKIDRNALPEQVVMTQSGLIPRSSMERWLVKEWKKLLSCQDVYADDDFFALGGNSLLAGRLMAGLRQKKGIDLPLTALFTTSVLQDFALLLAQECDDKQSILAVDKTKNEKSISLDTLVVLLKKGKADSSPLFVIHPAGGHVKSYADLIANLPDEQTVYGIQSPQLFDFSSAPDRIEDFAILYLKVIRHVQNKGAIRLLGWSFGAWLAIAVTHLVESEGGKVDWLGIVDARSDMQKTKLILPDLPQLSGYLACLDNTMRHQLLTTEYASLEQLEKTLKPLDKEESDNIAFDCFVTFMENTVSQQSNEEFNYEVHYLQMKLFMKCHKLMQTYHLKAVSTPMYVWWASDTLKEKSYQKSADKNEWEILGAKNVFVLDGDHQSIIKDPILAQQIAKKLAK